MSSVFNKQQVMNWMREGIVGDKVRKVIKRKTDHVGPVGHCKNLPFCCKTWSHREVLGREITWSDIFKEPSELYWESSVGKKEQKDKLEVSAIIQISNNNVNQNAHGGDSVKRSVSEYFKIETISFTDRLAMGCYKCLA